MFQTSPAATEAAKALLPHVDRPTVRHRFLFRDQAVTIEKGQPDYEQRGYIEQYGLDGVCIVEVTDLPPCIRKTETDYTAQADDEGNYPTIPHVHKAWCNRFTAAIPFVRSPTSVRVNAKEYKDERHAWGWDGNREKPSLTPSFLMEHFHGIDDVPFALDADGKGGLLPGVFIRLHVFVGDPYGPGTGRFGPGALDALESHIKTHDGRQLPMVLG